MYILVITKAIKNISINEIKDFKESSLLFNETLEKDICCCSLTK